MSRKIGNIINHIFVRQFFPSLISAVFYFIPSKKNTLLLIKTDGIGDYILFRNFIAFLKQSPQYANYKISLLTNDAYAEWATQLEKDTVERVYTCNDGLFLNQQLIKLILKIQLLRADTIIYPNYSRKYLIDWLISKVKARHKIGMFGNVANQPASSLLKTNKFYTRLINSPQENLHEFDRNKLFFEAVMNQKSHLNKPIILHKELSKSDNEYVVVFIGGSDKAKKWNHSKFAALCNMLINNKKVGVVIAGGGNDVSDGKLIEQETGSKMIKNLTGQLSLEDLTDLIAGAKLLVTGDTVALHLAVATNAPAVCLYKGDFYGRFVPYPSHISNQVAVVLPPNRDFTTYSYSHLSDADINTIDADNVYKVVVDRIEQQLVN